jgi:endonuclease/exonuclease/phosphatase (EEP) superfamily protein YafD
VHAVRLDEGIWVGNVHTDADVSQARFAAEVVRRWASGEPVVLGGDFNVSPLSLDRFSLAGADGVDQVFVSGGLSAKGDARVLERGPLSDHPPLVMSVMKKAE